MDSYIFHLRIAQLIPWHREFFNHLPFYSTEVFFFFLNSYLFIGSILSCWFVGAAVASFTWISCLVSCIETLFFVLFMCYDCYIVFRSFFITVGNPRQHFYKVSLSFSLSLCSMKTGVCWFGFYFHRNITWIQDSWLLFFYTW